MAIEQPLLDILACPIDKKGLLLFEDEAILYNPRLRRSYRLSDGYPVMLANRAEPATEEEHRRLIKRAAHGEAVGTAGFTAEFISEPHEPKGPVPPGLTSEEETEASRCGLYQLITS